MVLGPTRPTVPWRRLLPALLGGLLLTSAHAQTLDELAARIAEFQTDAQAVYRFDEGARNAVWEAYCGVFDPSSPLSGRDFAFEIGLDHQQQQEDLWDDAMGQTDGLIDALEPFQADPATAERANELFATVQKEVGTLRALETGAVLRGANHPFVQFAIQYGVDAHTRLCSSEGEDPRVCDKTWPSMSGRPDLVFVDDDGLWIYEFKPDNPRAVGEGETQVRGYVEGVEAYYQSFFPQGRAAGYTVYPDGDHGGEAIVKKIAETDDAWNGDAVEAQWEVVTYDRCEARF